MDVGFSVVRKQCTSELGGLCTGGFHQYSCAVAGVPLYRTWSTLSGETLMVIDMATCDCCCS
jgi:hypothetical protein